MEFGIYPWDLFFLMDNLSDPTDFKLKSLRFFLPLFGQYSYRTYQFAKQDTYIIILNIQNEWLLARTASVARKKCRINAHLLIIGVVVKDKE